MSFAGRKRKRRSEIKLRNKRRKKVAKLRAKIANAKTEGDREILYRKVRRIAPGVTIKK